MQNESSATKAFVGERLGVLIVDDDIEILNQVNHELKNSYDVFTAKNIVQAMDTLKKHKVAIALCDDHLAGESGSSLLVEIKNQYPEIIRILIAGYTDTNAIMNAVNKANVFKFLVKPWGKQLRVIVDEASQHYLSNRKNEYKDSLTSLKSENAILDSLHSEIKRSNRYKTNLSTILISITNPKKESALHDFLVDHLLLTKIAEILAYELRDSDVAGRLRDNNFLVLLTETDSAGADIFLNRFLKQIDAFENKVNRGLLPYQINSAKFTLGGDKSAEAKELIDKLFAQLSDISVEKEN